MKLTYDVYFNDENSSNNKKFKDASLEDCIDYIEANNGSNESYFGCYKGGTVSVRCNETEEMVFETLIL